MASSRRKLTARKLKILEVVRKHPGLHPQRIGELAGIRPCIAQDVLEELRSHWRLVHCIKCPCRVNSYLWYPGEEPQVVPVKRRQTPRNKEAQQRVAELWAEYWERLLFGIGCLAGCG